MANSQAASTVSQQWDDHETETILLHFINNKSEIGDAGNFEKKTYTVAAGTIPGQTRSSQVQTKWQASYQDTSGVHWDSSENEQDIGKGANITSDAEAQVWQTMINSKRNHPMKPFCNGGWWWLQYMEKILPVAGATGAHSYVVTEADPPSLTGDQDQESDHALLQAPGNDLMNVNSVSQPSISTSTPTSSISYLPTESGSAVALSVLSTECSKKSKKSLLEKGKRARMTSEHSSAHSSKSTIPSTSQHVNKVTPAVAIVELHGSIKDMTQAILVASKPPESVGDKAAVHCQEAVHLVQAHNDGLSVMEKATLIIFFGDHDKEVDMYIALDDSEL
ncbi:hypothetical protein L208DRAFT_1381900 [Tricholoma matsutake]|nr:hypothetical protein L208DRAFT_1381900 [Tricholoma matsutake 945]